ncbi:MAG: YhfC family intramembrane metalloprotease [Clostridia bacterium]|nr:YhfC family intramembrane metalloprotease [Clostridia bacterium]
MNIGTVPGLTCVFLGLIVVVCILVPVLSGILAKKKLGGNPANIIIGALVFFVFAYVLESLMHVLVLKGPGKGITESIWLYALYGGLAAGIFEETGRFVAMKKVMKKPLIKQNSVMYGIGHGGIEMILVGAMGAISNIAISVMVNSGMADKVFGSVPADQMEQAIAQYSPLWTSSPFVFGLSAVERILAFTLQICLSYIVYRAVKDNRIQLFILAIFIHFFVDGAAVVLASKANTYIAEAFLFVLTVAIAVVIVNLYKKEEV